MQKKILKAARDWVKKAKALRELDLVRDVNNNKKSLYRYISDKERLGKMWSPSGRKQRGWLPRWRRLSDFSPVVFTDKCTSHTAQVTEDKAETGRMKHHPVQEKISSSTI